MKRALSTVLLAVSIMLSGCEGAQFGAREAGALGGAGLGAGLGAIIGHKVGATGAGIAIGSGTGALAGALVGQSVDQQHARIDATDRSLAEQEALIAENRQLIAELRGFGVDVSDTDRGIVVNLPDVFFEFDKATLTAEARRSARNIAQVVRRVEGRRILIEGHTDSVGSAEYNQGLSEERARSVAAELVSNGVRRGNVFTRGLGLSDPVASNDTPAGRARNRRVEVIIEN
jgi:outer membrane protein OmpA-like peptidoglycan-associated protein